MFQMPCWICLVSQRKYCRVCASVTCLGSATLKLHAIFLQWGVYNCSSYSDLQHHKLFLLCLNPKSDDDYGQICWVGEIYQLWPAMWCYNARTSRWLNGSSVFAVLTTNRHYFHQRFLGCWWCWVLFAWSGSIIQNGRRKSMRWEGTWMLKCISI